MSSSNSSTSSAASLVSALALYGIIAIIIYAAFLILRPRVKPVYQKKRYAQSLPDSRRPRALDNGPIGWLKDLASRPDSEVIAEAGIDGYFFLRYLRMLFVISIFGMLINWPILMSVTATSPGDKTQLDKLTMANIVDSQSNRYYAHVFVSWVFYGVTLFFIYRETVFYVSTRQAVLTTDNYRTRLSSRSVVINGAPSSLLTPQYLGTLFQGIKAIIIARDAKEVEKEVKKRDKLVSKVEGTVNKVLKKGVKSRQAAEKKGEGKGPEITNYVKKMPTHRLKPLIGKKVDTMEYAKTEVPQLNTKIASLQRDMDKQKVLTAAIITFHSQAQAELAQQALSHHNAFTLAPKFVGVAPEEIVWSNLNLVWWQRLVKRLGVTVFLTCMIIFWAIPVSFVGFISQIKELEALFPWLDFLENLPNVLYGLISSLLPTVLLAVLMSLVPIIIRKCAKLAGEPSTTHVEYFTQQWYFAFQIVEVFFVTTFAASAMSVINDIKEEGAEAVLDLLRTKVPQANNFYISYFLLLGLLGPAKALLQAVGVACFYALGAILDGTPRKKWNRRNVLSGPGWGSVIPTFTMMGCIMLIYGIISPFILLFTALAFGLMYCAQLHNLVFINKATNGRGVYYARALNQLFVGLYIAQLCLIAMFVFGKRWGPLALEIVMIVVTIFVQFQVSKAFAPLLFSLPRSLTADEDVGSSQQQSSGSPFAGDADSEEKAISGTYSSKPRSNSQTALVDQEATYASQSAQYEMPPQANFIVRFFKPWIYASPAVQKQKLLTEPIWHNPPKEMTKDEDKLAWLHPAFTASNPVVWFPSDPYGWAENERRDLREHDINAFTSGAAWEITEKEKLAMTFSESSSDIPVYEQESEF